MVFEEIEVVGRRGEKVEKRLKVVADGGYRRGLEEMIKGGYLVVRLEVKAEPVVESLSELGVEESKRVPQGDIKECRAVFGVRVVLRI